MLAATATVTPVMRKDVIDKLDMKGCQLVSMSPDWPNITYYVRVRTTVEYDFVHIVEDMRSNSLNANRVFVYCCSINMCSDLCANFLYELQEMSYYPLDAEQISDNRLFGMFHSNTADHNKEVILRSMVNKDGIVKSCFCYNGFGNGCELHQSEYHHPLWGTQVFR